jgi:hypothetical protein
MLYNAIQPNSTSTSLSHEEKVRISDICTTGGYSPIVCISLEAKQERHYGLCIDLYGYALQCVADEETAADLINCKRF